MIKTAMNVEEINLMQPEGEEEEEILSPSPHPLSRMDTVRSPEYNPKHEQSKIKMFICLCLKLKK